MRIITSARPSGSLSLKTIWSVKKGVKKDDKPSTPRSNLSSARCKRANTKKPVTKGVTQNRTLTADKCKAILHNLQDEGERDQEITHNVGFSYYRWRGFRSATSKIDGIINEAKSRNDVKTAMKKAEGIEWDRKICEEDRKRRKRKRSEIALVDRRRNVESGLLW